MKRFFIFAISILVLGLLLGSVPLFFHGPRNISVLENIHGIPFAQDNGAIQVTEALAHADIFLKEPVLAKQVKLTITFNSQTLEKLSVGIRENSFWLSYEPVVIYNSTLEKTDSPITKTITVPLTDKLQEPDKSIDLMFFANNAKEKNLLDQKNLDTTEWQLISVTAEVERVIPTKAQLKDYIKSVIYREKAL